MSDQTKQPKLDQQSAGVKYDNSKPRFSLVPQTALARVMDVLEFGARKYTEDNWRKVDNAQQRYVDAAMRHTMAYLRGERLDGETGINHLAHAICCLMFTLELDETNTKGPADHILDAMSYASVAQRQSEASRKRASLILDSSPKFSDLDAATSATNAALSADATRPLKNSQILAKRAELFAGLSELLSPLCRSSLPPTDEYLDTLETAVNNLRQFLKTHMLRLSMSEMSLLELADSKIRSRVI